MILIPRPLAWILETMTSFISCRTLVLAASVIVGAFATSHAPNPTVHAAAGVFVGSNEIPGFDQFLGIPYAEPPIGNLRFRNPQLSSALPDPFMATTYGPGCIQDAMFTMYNGLSEDCLTLNVIRPQNEASDEPLPVLFFIHGGGNLNGQSIFYNGTALVEYSVQIGRPIIYVACNYRLGGFGFLNSPDFQAQGISNLGLKDQYLALEWTHKNIASFGGNPSKTILFGESAGAWNAQNQLDRAYSLSQTNKLFQGMITQSGSAGGLGPPHLEPPSAGAPTYQDLLNATNCTQASDSVACLRDVDLSLLSPLLLEGNPAPWFALDNDWFKTSLTDILVNYELAHVPILHGCNLDEGSAFLADPFNPPNGSVLVEYITPLLNGSTALAKGVVEV